MREEDAMEMLYAHVVRAISMCDLMRRMDFDLEMVEKIEPGLIEAEKLICGYRRRQSDEEEMCC